MHKLLLATAATIALSGAAFAQEGPFNGGGFADAGSAGTYTSTRSNLSYAAPAQNRQMSSSNLSTTSTFSGSRAGVGSGAVGQLGGMS